MTTEEQQQSPDTYRSNGTEDDHDHGNEDEHENDDDTGLSSSQPPTRRSRFFRSKRKQRINHEQSPQVNSNSDISNESVISFESPEPSDESLLTETVDSDLPDHGKVVWRASSPPPPVSLDDNDGSNTSDESKLSTSTDDLTTVEQNPPETSKEPEKKVVAQARASLPTIYAGYQRKKSQSVKLTSIAPFDSCPKKAVRFADDFGLDLSQVKMIKTDELPHVPSAAFKDLRLDQDENASGSSSFQERMKVITYLEQQFENPIHIHGFDDRVLRHKIVLEQANAIDNRIYGTIKLVSFGMDKRVKIRLTADNWITSNDYEATYVTNSFDGTFDRFSFTLEIDRERICLGNHIQFCLCYESYGGQECWDSNYQQNYRFSCVSRTIPDYS